MIWKRFLIKKIMNRFVRSETRPGQYARLTRSSTYIGLAGLLENHQVQNPVDLEKHPRRHVVKKPSFGN